MTRLHAISHKFHVCKSLIVASVIWIVILIFFYYSLDPELVVDIEKTRVSLVHDKAPAKLEKKIEELERDSLLDITVKDETTKMQIKETKKLNEAFGYKKIVTPIPPEIIKELGLVNPGENGRAVVLSNVSARVQQKIDRGWKRHQFNEFLSDIISIRRNLQDPREAYCKQDGLYLEQLPSTSVIVIFHNEAWSTLLRTVHSVLDRSPEHLIEEIILVDDFSNMRNELHIYIFFLSCNQTYF